MGIVQQIALAIWRWLTPQVEGILDPQYAARLAKIKADEVAQDAKVQEAKSAAIASEAAYQTSLNHRKELDRLIAASVEQENASEQRLAESQQRVKQFEVENQKAKDTLDKLSGGDRVRVDL